MKLLLAAALFAVPLPAYAQNPPPNWEMTLPGARQWAKDVCSERDNLRRDRACYAAFLRQQAANRTEDQAARRRLLCHGPTENIPDDDPALALYTEGTLEQRKFDLISDRTEACAVSETTAVADPTLSFRCTLRYQRWTRWEYWSDDRWSCSNLRRPRR